MGFIARSYDTATPFTDAQALEALERVVSADAIRAAATRAAVPTQRRRKLPADVTLLLCLGMSLFTAQALDVVLATMTHGLRLFWPGPEPVLATKGAIAWGRARSWPSSTRCASPWRRRGHPARSSSACA